MHKLADFSIIETILWEKGTYFLLELHLERLRKSAFFFGFPYDDTAIFKALEETSSSLESDRQYRVRLLLAPTGAITIQHSVLDEAPEVPVKIVLSDKRIDKNDMFFYHKTTNREFYDAALAVCRKKGFFDVIFLNQDGEITEGAISNILMEKDGIYYTPPVSCGLLPGVYREYLLSGGELPIKEKVLFKEDLYGSSKIFLTNSVRKIMPAKLVR